MQGFFDFKEQCQSYTDDKVKSELIRCNNIGTKRTDNGLESGIHCDDCWEKMIYECRQKSW